MTLALKDPCYSIALKTASNQTICFIHLSYHMDSKEHFISICFVTLLFVVLQETCCQQNSRRTTSQTRQISNI